MSTTPRPRLSPREIRREGWTALTERLGVSGAIRFMMQYDAGHGDYSIERHDLLADLTLDQALAEVKALERARDRS